jgi:hypothetical protein
MVVWGLVRLRAGLRSANLDRSKPILKAWKLWDQLNGAIEVSRFKDGNAAELFLSFRIGTIGMASVEQYLMDRDPEIALARSAAPDLSRQRPRGSSPVALPIPQGQKLDAEWARENYLIGWPMQAGFPDCLVVLEKIDHSPPVAFEVRVEELVRIGRLAPLEKVSFTLSLWALPTAIIPSWDQRKARLALDKRRIAVRKGWSFSSIIIMML